MFYQPANKTPAIECRLFVASVFCLCFTEPFSLSVDYPCVCDEFMKRKKEKEKRKRKRN